MVFTTMESFLALRAFRVFTTLAVWSVFFTPTDGFQTLAHLEDYRNPSSLSFSGGDVIACRMDFNLWASLYGAEHVYLALSSTHVSHIWDTDEKKATDNYGTLKNEKLITMTERSHITRCRVATNQFNEAMATLNAYPKYSSSAISDAKSDRGRRVYYNLFTCNCEHCVTYWKYGKAWSIQSNQGPGSRCSLTNYFLAMGPRGNAYYSNQNGHLNTQANAVAGDTNFGKGVFNGRAMGPNSGAHFYGGTEGLGTGFKAGLGEVRGNLGKSVGASLGLAVDTQVGVSKDGAALQLLGTGIGYSRKDGFKMCFFGSCLYLG